MSEIHFYELQRFTACQCELKEIDCRLEAMKAENQLCAFLGIKPKYLKSDFEILVNEIAGIINRIYNPF